MQNPDFELAAALFSLLGEPVPHPPGLDAEAERLKREAADKWELYQHILHLCGNPESPEQEFLCAKVYGRMGKEHSGDVIRCAEAYLHSKGWEALGQTSREEDGIRVEGEASSRASLLLDLAAAYESAEQMEQAYSCARKAYLLEPYRRNRRRGRPIC